MIFDDITNIRKDERSSGFVGSMRERLKAAKVPFVVAGAVAAMGMYDLVKQPAASAAVNPQRGIQVATLFKSREQRFLERMNYLIDKLEQIRAEVHAEDGGAFYKQQIEFLDKHINFNDAMKEDYEISKRQFIRVRDQEKLFFYEHYYNDIITKQQGNYIEIPEMCAARGERWCEPTVGLYIAIIDPNIKKTETINSVKVPTPNKDAGIMRISTKYYSRGVKGAEIIKPNQLVYKNAMKHVYKFFEGEITKDELDEVTAEIIKKGKDDCIVWDINDKVEDLRNNGQSIKGMYEQKQKAIYFPDTKTERVYKGKKYVISYDNYYGNIIIEFPLK